MFLFSLIFEYLKLNEGNYDESLKLNNGKPVAILFWHTFCPHSKKFLPIWQNIVANSGSNNDYLLGEVECQSNPTICKEKISEKYPQILWVDQKLNITDLYDGEKNFDSVMRYFKDMKYYPCSVSLTEFEIKEKERQATEFSPFYKFIIPKSDQNILDLAKSSFKEANVTRKKIFCKLCERFSPKLITYGIGSKNDDNIYSDDYKGEFNHKDLVDYIKTTNLGQIIDFSNETYKTLQKGKKVYIIISADSKTLKSLEIIVESLNDNHFRFAFEKFDAIKSIAKRIFKFKSSKTPFIAAVDPILSKYTQYKGNINVGELQKWLSSIQKTSAWNDYDSNGNITEEDKKLYIWWLIILIAPIVIGIIIIYMKKPKYKKIPKVLVEA